MIVTFVFPTTPVYSGGVAAMFEFAGGLARLGHEVHFVHGPAWPGRIRDLDDLSWFSFDPRIVHHVADDLADPSLPEGDVVFSPSVAPRFGAPAAFVQGHGMMDEAWERATLRARCPKFCVARWLVDVGVHYGAPRDQMRYVPMGLDHDLFSIRRPLDDRPVDVAVLYSSHPAKGFPTAVQALEAVRAARPDLSVVAFSVPEPDKPLPPWMELRRDPPRRALADEIYNSAKVFIQASRYEGFGFTAVEAMACGAALVTTDNGGSRDYALHDRTALVAPVDDAAALADGIGSLLDDPDRRADLALAGARSVRRFDWDHGAAVLAAHLEAYVADPAAYQREPGVDRSLERPFRVGDLPAPVDVAGP